MGKYIIKRLLWMIPVILGVAILIFTIMYFTPGDPGTIILGNGASQEDIAAYNAMLGLDRPFFVQLLDYLKNLFLKFELGVSWVNNKSVTEDLLRRLPLTAMIAFFSCILQVIIGIPLGITAAVHRNKLQDRIIVFFAMLGMSVPGFWLAMMMIVLFSLKLRWLPAFGITEWKCFIMPVVCASIIGIAGQARSTRTYMLETIRSDYIVTARSKGLSEHTIRYKHALPNTLIPVITGVGGHFGRALGGTVIIENVFSIPGVGSYMVGAIGNRDYPIVRSSVVVLATLFSIIMVLVDLAYAYVDPRIKAQYSNGQKRR